MKPRLVQYLVCPNCRQRPFHLKVRDQDAGGEIIEGSLECRGCRRVFPIRFGIPRMAPGPLPAAAHDTVAAFGWQWQKFNASLQNSRFDSRDLFLDFIAPVSESFFSDKVVLDAGCGIGRFGKLAHAFGAREVICIDLSSAVEVAYKNVGRLANIHVLQADIHNLPFANIFDYVFSIGVLHHLPQPQHGFLALVRHLKPSGSISIWVYGHEHNEWLLRFGDRLRQSVTSRLPAALLNGLCHGLAILIYPALQLFYRPPKRSDGRDSGHSNRPYGDYLSYLAQFDYATVHAVIFDHMSPRISHYLSREELSHWFTPAMWAEVLITPRTGNSWRVLASLRAA